MNHNSQRRCPVCAQLVWVRCDGVLTKHKRLLGEFGFQPCRGSGLPRTHPAKVGTVPKTIVVDGRCRLVVGRVLRFRCYPEDSPNQWRQGRISKIQSDGRIFIDL